VCCHQRRARRAEGHSSAPRLFLFLLLLLHLLHLLPLFFLLLLFLPLLLLLLLFLLSCSSPSLVLLLILLLLLFLLLLLLLFLLLLFLLLLLLLFFLLLLHPLTSQDLVEAVRRVPFLHNDISALFSVLADLRDELRLTWEARERRLVLLANIRLLFSA